MAAAKKATTPAAEKKVETAKVEAPKATVKAEASKAEAPKAAVKAAVKKEEPAKKETAKKETVKKEAVKKETKKAAAPAKKTAAKKADKKVDVQIQFGGKSYTQEDLVNIAKDVWKYDLKQKAGDLQSIELYVKPEESLVYYVMNTEFAGSFAI